MLPPLDEMDFATLKALLDWQVEMGATEAIGDVPVDRTAVVARPAAPVATAAPVGLDADPVAQAQAAAAGATTLDQLRDAIAAYPHCDLRRGARQVVFADGNPMARVMIVGEAPGREEDRTGKPFVGPAGQMLDRMFAAIGLSRTSDEPEAALYLTNVLPWRPPENREPLPDEIAMLKPFLLRHIALVAPRVLVLMGNVSCQTLLGKRGITRLRGRWDQAAGLPALPMLHPAYLLRTPHEKRQAWADLLALQAHLRGPA